MVGSVCICCFLGIHTWEDIRKQEISVKILGIFGGIGVLYALFLREVGIMEFFGGFIPGILLLLLGKLSREAVGYGDGSIVLVLGLYLSFWKILGILVTASVLAGLWAVGLLVFRKAGKAIPFVPFLLMGFLGGLI